MRPELGRRLSILARRTGGAGLRNSTEILHGSGRHEEPYDMQFLKQRKGLVVQEAEQQILDPRHV